MTGYMHCFRQLMETLLRNSHTVKSNLVFLHRVNLSNEKVLRWGHLADELLYRISENRQNL